MPLLTKEELFGDNGAHGNQVPIDLAAPRADTGTPTTYASSVRAIGFGEWLTAKIANRMFWAQALNDEYLNGFIITTKDLLVSQIAAVSANLQSAINDYNTKITNEQTARQNADSAEVTNRTNADAQLQTNITNEANARASADTTLTNNLAAEVTARSNAVSTLTTNLGNEVTARTNADSAITTKYDKVYTYDLTGASASWPAINTKVKAIDDRLAVIEKSDASPGLTWRVIQLEGGSASSGAVSALTTRVGNLETLAVGSSDNVSQTRAATTAIATHTNDIALINYTLPDKLSRSAGGQVTGHTRFSKYTGARTVAYAGTNRISVPFNSSYPTEGAPGMIVDLWNGSSLVGTFQVIALERIDLSSDYYWHLQNLDGSTPSFPPSGGLSCYTLAGAVLQGPLSSVPMGWRGNYPGETIDPGSSESGELAVNVTGSDSFPSAWGPAGARVIGPQDTVLNGGYWNAPVALHLGNQSYFANAMLIRGTNRGDGDVFIVTADGKVHAKSGMRAPTMRANTFQGGSFVGSSYSFSAVRTVNERFIPRCQWRVWNGSLPSGWQTPGLGPWLIGGGASNANDILEAPISGLIPNGATITALRLIYGNTGGNTGTRPHFGLWKRDGLNLGDLTISKFFLQEIATARYGGDGQLPNADTGGFNAGQVPVTVPAGFVTSASGDQYSACVHFPAVSNTAWTFHGITVSYTYSAL